MHHSICKIVIRNRTVGSKTSHVRYIQTITFVNSGSNPIGKQSLTVSYLFNSCGLSLELAIAASKVVKIENTEKPDSLLKLLTTDGFTKAHISSLISKHPPFILAHSEKTMTQARIFSVIGTGPLWFDGTKTVVPNIYTLRAHGMLKQHVAKLVIMRPKSVVSRTDLFKEVVSAIKEMGFVPTTTSFILAVASMSTLSKVNWEKKMESKIRDVMDFLMNTAGLKPSDVAGCPNLFLTSVERRMIPRCVVMQVLMSKNLVRKDLDLIWRLNSKKYDFEKSFVAPFVEDAPDVIKACQGKTEFQGFSHCL
ncbi:hypothetical protein I3760_03G045900 [Carya illinoinensis]|nr:hypothetical protein I3760_03G045900 [Carya illinoinensis]